VSFTLPVLPYAADSLEKAIDKTTMEIHHGRHHKAYVDNLNSALAGHDQLLAKSIDQLMRDIKEVPESIRQKVINNGGGHANHSLFWGTMSPNGGGEPKGRLADAIKSSFGDFSNLKSKIKESALGRFGSGWSWLVLSGGKLEITSTANQDTPLMVGSFPLFGIDVWEHAYYLRYQNKRADYVDAWWNVANWDEIGVRFDKGN
jgi:Fe-Mn family superoxide dismutase